MRRSVLIVLALPTIALAQPEWSELQVHGFTVDVRGAAKISFENQQWKDFGRVAILNWDMRPEGAAHAIDIVSCYGAPVPQPTLLNELHGVFCQEDHPGQRRWDDRTIEAGGADAAGKGPQTRSC